MLLPGCFKRTVRVGGNFYGDRDVIPNGFAKNSRFVVAGNSVVNGVEQFNELQTKEVKKKIELFLKSKDYRVRDRLEDSDYCIIFNYGSKTETKVVNVREYVPGGTTTTQGKVNLYGYQSNSANYSETTAHAGTYIYVPREYTYCTKFISLYVYNAASCKKELDSKSGVTPPQIWYGLVWQVDGCTDLRPYIDFLLVGLSDFFGKNTGGEVSFDIDEDCERLLFFRNLYLHFG